MIDIQPQYVALSKLLSGRLFRIPEYQRAYSWTSKQRRDLFDDINTVAESTDDTIHFMATVVGLRRERRTIITDDYQVVEVVDGQQRLTTLILLLKATALSLDRADALQDRVGRELDETLVKPDQASLLLLQTNHDTGHHFADYLRKGVHSSWDKATTIADRELLRGMEECELFVQDWKHSRHLSELVALLKNRLTFIFHEISQEAIVYTVFEVLNSRGLEVSWFDRLKSMLMGIAFKTGLGNQKEIIDELHNLWRDIYTCIGLRQGMSNEALRFAATLQMTTKPNKPLSEEDAAELLRERAQSGGNAVVETTKWLKSVTEAVDRLWADNRRNAVRQISQARLLAVALHLRKDLSPRDLERTLRRWENLTFRIYGMLRNDSRTRVGDYVRLAWRTLNEQLSQTDIHAELAKIGAEFPLNEAIDSLRKVNCYSEWQEELRYFFFRYEEYLARQNGQIFDNEQWNRIWLASAADSIEHIMPQSAGSDELVHRLGNLVLLPPKLNSKLGAKKPKEKRLEYQKTGLLIAIQVADSLDHWNASAVKTREDALLDWAANEWAD